MDIYHINQSTLAELQSNLIDAKEGLDLSHFINHREPMRVTSEKVAIIDIKGALMQSAPPVMETLGNTNYETIEREISEALEQGAESILFRVRSGGGMAKGCEEVASIISSVPVPTVAHGTGLMCSASYKLASSCDIVSATPSCDCGNVGTILAYSDTSKAHERMGVEKKAFSNKEAILKSTFHAGSLTEEQEGFMQEQIDEAGARFINHVKAHRPNVSEEAWKAGWYCGVKAVELGLIDGIGTFQDALQTAIQIQHQIETL